MERPAPESRWVISLRACGRNGVPNPVQGLVESDRSYLGQEAVATAREFLDRFTFSGRMPADELAALAADPQMSLAWAVGGSDATVPDSSHEPARRVLSAGSPVGEPTNPCRTAC